MQRKPSAADGGRTTVAADVALAPLRATGRALEPTQRALLERSFDRDFSGVRVHADTEAANAAQRLGARAYTLGEHIVFGAAQYAPASTHGLHLLAHELTHVLQQRGSGPTIQRACLSGAVCTAPPGSASGFGTAVESREAAARARRARMSPARQRVHGHTGPARQLELLLNAQAPGLLANIHGIFIDQDMDPHVAASTQDCASMVPPITGATKPCVFVPGALNQQALQFNTDPTATTIGGRSREDWRIDTVQTLGHEIQHVKYDDTISPTAVPAGVTTCTRASVDHELSELNAIMSEFPIVFDAVPVGAAATDPAAVRLHDWFDHSITNTGESIRGIVTVLRCGCSCSDADLFIKETFHFVSSSWTAAQKNAFNTELRKPVWSLSWPL